MLSSDACLDPYGSPEVYVDGIAYREMVGSENVRTAFFARERGELIIRVKLIIPVAISMQAHADLRQFLALQAPRLMRAS